MSDTENAVMVQRRDSTRGMPSVEIEMGLAYEFIESLLVYYDKYGEDESACDCEYEVGDAWFENIRTSCSQALLEGLRDFTLQTQLERCELDSWAHLLGMVYDSPSPKDVPAFMSYLESLEPWEIRLYWLGYYQRNLRKVTPLDVILQAAEGDKEALELFLRTALPDSLVAQERVRRFIFTDADTMKDTLITLLWGWYEQVFCRQEAHIRPILERDIEAKRKLQATVSADRLIDLATNGLIYGAEAGVRRIVLIPGFLARPWNQIFNHQDVKVIVYPAADESVTPNRSTPSVQLVRLYQALADERRLRILKLLKTRSYSLQELSDAFGAAKSTMHHHLGLLRTAGLVRIRSSGEKQYSLRTEILSRVGQLLEDFLNDS